jgi:hypothetical protein
MAWPDALDIYPCDLCTLPECRSLNSNQLTGALPAAWSALAGLNYMWVPCTLADLRVPPCCGSSLLGLCGRHLVHWVPAAYFC